jgi:hypothetical protein
MATSYQTQTVTKASETTPTTPPPSATETTANNTFFVGLAQTVTKAAGAYDQRDFISQGRGQTEKGYHMTLRAAKNGKVIYYP